MRLHQVIQHAKRTTLGGLLACILAVALINCSSDKIVSEKAAEVSPWCIVAFDSLERSPAARIEMLKELGFSSYGYDCDIRYLDDMEEEFQLARENDITINAVWFWLNAKRDSVEKLSPRNQRILEIVARSDHKPEFWVSFSPNFFVELDQEQSMVLSIDMLTYINDLVRDLDCPIRIYNHKGWFGDIDNMVEIIETAAELDLKMIYNFHHGHEDLEDLPRVMAKIAPHLSAVNLNGMRKEGPKILTLGQGDREREMIHLLISNGFEGPWGILGHVKERDAKQVLQENLEGFRSLELPTPQ